MLVVPAATAVTRPLLVTVATDVLDEVQVTCVDTLRVVPSEYEPEAASCWVFPGGTLAVSGVTDTEDNVALVTVRVTVPEILPEVAVMIVVPAATVVTRPLLLTVAADALDELQATCVVISRLVPLPYMPEAANWLVAPDGRLGLAGVTDMETSEVPASSAETSFEPVPPPHPANSRKITQRGIIPVNNHLSLRLFILLPPYLLAIRKWHNGFRN